MVPSWTKPWPSFPFSETNLADVSNIFYFFLLGEGEGGVRGRQEAGGSVFYWQSQRGGGLLGGEGTRGRESVVGELGISRGGGGGV